MINQPVQQRTSFTISPLVVIGVIFLALVFVEALLAARFWLQLASANASEGLSQVVLDLSKPLVAPFSDAQESARDVGAFERNTLVAAMAYLVGAVILAFLTMLAGGLLTGNEALERRHRRSALAHFEHPLIDRSGARLISTATLPINPEQAARLLRMVHLDCISTQLFVIPASGGCIVAAFAPADGEDGGLLASSREAFKVKRALRLIEQRFQTRARQPVGASAN